MSQLPLAIATVLSSAVTACAYVYSADKLATGIEQGLTNLGKGTVREIAVLQGIDVEARRRLLQHKDEGNIDPNGPSN